MKCINCGKIVPSSYNNCPYCNTPIDPNQKEVINFGELQEDSFNNDNALDIKTFMKEPKNKKYIYIGIAGIIVIVLIFGVLIMSLFGNKESSKKYFNAIVEDVSEYLIDNYTGSNSKLSGSYKFIMKYNNDNYDFEGKYQIDTKNRIVNLTNKMNDPNIKNGGVIQEIKNLDFNIYLKEDDLYFESAKLINKPLYLPIDDTTGLLTTKNYNLDSFISGYSDAILEGIKVLTPKESNETITYLGAQTKVRKATLVFNNANKLKFSNAFYDCLIEDTNFVNEYARISNKKSDDIVQMLTNYKTTNQYEYDGESQYETLISIYYKSGKLYRIEIEFNEENNIDTYKLDIGETKYYLEKLTDGKNVFNFTIAKVENEKADVIEKLYTIEYDQDGVVVDIDLKVKADKNPSIKKVTYEDVYNIRKMSQEQLSSFKNSLNYYFKHVEWVDKLPEIFKNRCDSSLECTCEDDVCNCNYEGSIIKCPIEDIQPTSVEKTQ